MNHMLRQKSTSRWTGVGREGSRKGFEADRKRHARRYDGSAVHENLRTFKLERLVDIHRECLEQCGQRVGRVELVVLVRTANLTVRWSGVDEQGVVWGGIGTWPD